VPSSDTVAAMTEIEAKPIGASHMATPALTRKELLERLDIEFPESRHALGGL
jgi:hypothetical protein